MYIHSEYHLYHIINVDGGTLECNEIEKQVCHFPETKHVLKWSNVGVFKRGPTSSLSVFLDSKNVSGKLLMIQEFLITCPVNVLQES